MKRILLIDTSSNKEIRVGLKIGKKEYVIRQKIGKKRVQAVLPLIDRVIKKKKLEISEIDCIKLNTRPGSFTGIRVGMAIANALTFALKIPAKPSLTWRSRV
jgi:tRNA threonylcarbamoyladenosine biosynthesis protein TsaB